MELIDRQAALDCFHDWIDKRGNVYCADESEEYQRIEALPSAELDGYSIEQLLFIAKLMASANVTPETLVNTLKDVEKTVRLVLKLVRRQSEDAIIKVIMNGEVTE